MLVSFDFDYTLSEPHIQDFAKKMMQAGHKIIIITSRQDDEHLEKLNNKLLIKKPEYIRTNSDLYGVAQKLNISDTYFSSGDLKVNLMKNNNVVPDMHIDDDYIELIGIEKTFPNMIRINVMEENWEEQIINKIEGFIFESTFLFLPVFSKNLNSYF